MCADVCSYGQVISSLDSIAEYFSRAEVERKGKRWMLQRFACKSNLFFLINEIIEESWLKRYFMCVPHGEMAGEDVCSSSRHAGHSWVCGAVQDTASHVKPAQLLQQMWLTAELKGLTTSIQSQEFITPWCMKFPEFYTYTATTFQRGI